jgi:hypothetical protein
VTPTQAAAIAGVPQEHIADAIGAGALKARGQGESVRVAVSDVERWCRLQGIDWPGDERAETLVEGSSLVAYVLARLEWALPFGVPLVSEGLVRRNDLPPEPRERLPHKWVGVVQWVYPALRLLAKQGRLAPRYWLSSDVSLAGLIAGQMALLGPVSYPGLEQEMQETQRNWSETWWRYAAEGALVRASTEFEAPRWKPRYELLEEHFPGQWPVLRLALDMVPIYHVNDRFTLERALGEDIQRCSPFGNAPARDVRGLLESIRKRWGIRVPRSWAGKTREYRIKKVHSLLSRGERPQQIVTLLQEDGELAREITKAWRTEPPSRKDEVDALVAQLYAKHPEASHALLVEVAHLWKEGWEVNAILAAVGDVDQRTVERDIAAARQRKSLRPSRQR